jgi:mitofilin
LEAATLEAGGDAHRMFNLNRLWTAVRALDKATKNGSTPFARELDSVKQFGEHWPLVQTAASSIPTNVAAQGVLSEPQLAQWWRDSVRMKIKRASLMPEDGGLISHATSWILSHFMLDKKGLIPGEDVDAILARSDYHLNRGDLDAAAREVNQLNGWTKSLAHDWLTEARKTLSVRQLVEVRFSDSKTNLVRFLKRS